MLRAQALRSRTNVSLARALQLRTRARLELTERNSFRTSMTCTPCTLARCLATAPSKAPHVSGKTKMPPRGHVVPADAPKLSAVLRKFLLKVHPDLFADAEAVRSSNEKNVSEFNNFITSLKSRDIDDKLFRGNQNFTFFIRDFRPPIALTDGKQAPSSSPAKRLPKPGTTPPSAVPNWARSRVTCTAYPPKLLKITLELGSSGAPSKNILGPQLAALFSACDLPSDFIWDDAFLPPKTERRMQPSDEFEDDELSD